jgi:PEP-CTERM motif-containing protein
LKMRIASLSLLALCLTLAAVPAMAQVVYDNGPINGNTDAWNIAFGFIVSDTFTVANDGTQITGFNMADWLIPGDTVISAELSITSGENGGTSFFDQTVNFTQGGCTGNSFGFSVCQESTTFSGPTLNAGTYWINLQNASSTLGQSVFWDENSGASSASENELGTIPSEAFTVLGTGGGGSSSSSSSGGTVPEPSSIMLFGSGILGLAGVLRRKLF